MNYWQNYWHQEANKWVSMSVLAGGLLSAVILFFLARVQLGVEAFSIQNNANLISELGQ